jgi:hypothetical protein
MARPPSSRANRRTRIIWVAIGFTLFVASVAVGLAIMQEHARIKRIRQIQAVRAWPANTSLGPTARLRTACRGGTDTNSGQLQYHLTIGPQAPAMALLSPSPSVPVDTDTIVLVPDVGPPGETEFQELVRRREASYARMMRQMALSMVVHSTSNQFVIRFLDEDGFKQIELRVPPDSIEVTTDGLIANRTATSVACGSALLEYPSWTIHAEPYYGESAF